MESESDVGIELSERDAVTNDENDKERSSFSSFVGKENVVKTLSFIKKHDLSFSTIMKSSLVFFAIYVVIFYVFSQYIALRKIDSFRQTFFVVIVLVLFVAMVFSKDIPKTHAVFLTLAACVATNMFVEAAQRVDIMKKTKKVTLYSNLFPVLLFFPGAFGFRFSSYYLVVMTGVGVLYGLIQFYSVLFRGCPFRPVDSLALNGAFAVRNEYSLINPEGLALVALAVAHLACIVRFTFNNNIVPEKRKSVRGVLMLLCGLLLSLFIFRFNAIVKVLIDKGILVFWDLIRLYPGAGGFLAFYVDLRESVSDSTPLGYSKKKVEGILSQFESKDAVDASKLRRPNIIAIMSEAFTDYRSFGKFETNQDYMPFIRSLEKNTIKGFVSTTAYGGHSCDSEYEFLTGNSMGFFRYGLSAYLGILNDVQESLTYVLNDLGYNTIACSCARRDIWGVGKAYKLLEFNESYFSTEFYTIGQTHNGQGLDRDAFKGMLDIYDRRPKDKPLFFYFTSMQNHGDYFDIPNATVRAKGYEKVSQLNSYLTGLKLTDDAVKELIEHFSKVKEDVVIVFYGDHHPHIPKFTEKALGGPKDELPVEKRVLLQMTPYFIWANYPIKEEKENIALSYLSSKVMEVAGLPKSAYMNFLMDTKKHVPMITYFAYMDPKEVWHYRSEKTEASEYLDRYRLVQHYMMTDNKRKK